MTASDLATSERPARTIAQRASQLVQRFGIAIPFVITFVVLSLISPPFLRSQNLTNILDQQAGIIIVACAGALVLIAGGIDLSIGAIYGLAGAIALNTASSVSSPLGVIEHFVQNIGCLLASEDGKKNTAAKDRINETGRITREQPAITSELLVPIRKIRRGVYL